jgi:Flp pilus assembly protein TadD
MKKQGSGAGGRQSRKSSRPASPAADAGAKTPPGASVPPPNDSSPRPLNKGRLIAAVCALLVLLVVFVWTRRETFRERSLEGQSLESLRPVAEKADPSDTLVHYLYARRLVDAGDVAAASPPITRAVQSLTPSTAPDLVYRVFTLAGYIALQNNDSTRTEEWLKRSETIGQEDVFLYLTRGMLALKQDKAGDAIASLTKAARLDPERAEAWNRLGAAYMLGAEPERAVEPFRHATRLAPKNAQYYIDLAQALGGSKQYEEATKAMQTAVQLAPQNADYPVLLALGKAYAARTEAQYKECAAALKDILWTRPNDPKLRTMLAGVHMRFGRFAEARKELEQCVVLDPQNSPNWHSLALVCERLGDKPAAAAALARFYAIMERQMRAADLKKTALLHKDDVPTLLRVADAFADMGKNVDASVALSRAVSLRPNDAQIAKKLRAVQAKLDAGQTVPPTGSDPSVTVPREDAHK